MIRQYRAIVVGAGAIGAATAYWLSRRANGSVLLLEQFGLGHTRGASEDHSRVIRHAYDKALYTALTPAAYQCWGLVEAATGLRLVHKTGGLILGDADSEGAAELDAIATAMTSSNLPFETYDASAIRSRWPQLRVDDRHAGIFDPEAGVLDIRQATAAHLALARGNGVEVIQDTEVTSIEEIAGGVRVEAGGDAYLAADLVLCGGAWNPVLLRQLGVSLPIVLTEEQVTYFATTKLREFSMDRFPVWGWLDGADFYYGFPVYGEVAVKAGIDGGGRQVEPEDRTYTADPKRVEQVRRHLTARIPDAVGPELYTRVCCYDLTPDRDFIVDRIPGHDRVLVCVGAGHAAKFAGLLGRILSELTLDGTTRYPIDGFRADRPALTHAIQSDS